jgi:hypothetical protein
MVYYSKDVSDKLTTKSLTQTLTKNTTRQHKPVVTNPHKQHQSKSTMKLNLLLLSVATLANAANGSYLRTTTEVTAETAIDLGSAKEFVILAKAGISTVDPSAITGDIGVSPIAATAITGFGLTADSTNNFSTSPQIVGGAYAADYAVPTPETLTTAVLDMEAAYKEASARSNDDDDRTNPGDDGEIGGMTLTPGVYTFANDIKISDDVYFDGGPDDVFIIQTAGSISQAAGTKVTGGESDVKASNVFWQVAGHVTVGAGSLMEGILLVKEFALFETNSSLNGRILSQTACNLKQATITKPA